MLCLYLVNSGTKQLHGHHLKESVANATVSTIHAFAEANGGDISISMYHFTEFYRSLAAAPPPFINRSVITNFNLRRHKMRT
jgi:hypothetical protein